MAGYSSLEDDSEESMGLETRSLPHVACSACKGIGHASLVLIGQFSVDVCFFY